MNQDVYFKKYDRYKNLSETHKTIIIDLYKKFKSLNETNNEQLSRYLLMFVSAGVFYLGENFKINVETFNRNKINAIIECCSRTLPESGTIYGIQMCQIYNTPKQQNTLNVKKPKSNDINTSNDAYNINDTIEFDDADEWIRVKCTNPINKQIYSSMVFRDCIEKFHARDKNDLFLSMSQPKIIYTSYMVTTGTQSPIDAYTCLVRNCIRYCMCIELKKITTDSMTFITYHVNKSFFEKFTYNLYQIFGADSIVIWFTNERTIFTKKYAGKYFVSNYVDFLYCFMTNRFEPETPRTLNDVVTMMMCKLIAGIIKAIKFESLKSTGLYRAGYTPMSLITTEASLLNIRKLVNEIDANSEQTNTYNIYTPSESMFVNTAITRDTIEIHSNYK